jgi:4-hydroxythreonine-4-phosphate dehydrogenase
MGDPSGIGPETAVKALCDARIAQLGRITVIGDYFVIDKAKRSSASDAEFSLIDLSNVPQKDFSYGAERAAYGRAAVEYIDKAIELIGKGEADCLVTAPVNKAAVRKAGYAGFEGHTEYIAGKTRARAFAMMFVGKKLKVSLVTRHLALKDVAGSLTPDRVYDTIMLTADCLRKHFGIAEPKIGVAGLNPHAGEGGSFGNDEAEKIAPAIARASGAVKGLRGPVPADIVFHEALAGKLDAVVAMYHDQALAPFKMLHFIDGVNLTLGLPFVRTSPDHGTAFDIAGRGTADATSMKEAVSLACRLSGRHV